MKKRIRFLLGTLLLSLGALGQQISGIVSSAVNGAPLPGVSVLIKNTSTGTITNAEGAYRLNAPSNAVLVFSFVGFATQEITVAGRNSLNVQLAEDSKNLQEIVVTALGIKKESKKIGYATQTVQLNEMQENRTVNVMSSLEGKIAGLDVSPPSAGAGASTKIRLRGQSAFAGASNSPLIVINGLPMDQGARSANGNNSIDLGDNMQNVNPDDIESMTVLKGATAAALYGSRAANGAILITTKTGGKGQGLGVEFITNFSADEAMDFTDFQQVYGQGQAGVKPTTQGQAITTGQFGWGAKLDGQPYIQFDGVSRPYSANPNRITEFYRTGTNLTNTLAFSGGGQNGGFRASFSNTQSKGIHPVNDYTKRIFNIGVNQNIGEKITMTTNINYTHEDNENPPQVGVQGPGAPNFLYRMSTSIPLSAFKESVVNPNGTERQTSGFQTTLINPFFQMGRQFFYNKRDRFLGTSTIRYDIAKWLYVQGRLNYDYSISFNEFNTPTGMGTSTPFNSANTGYNGFYQVQEDKGTDINADFLIGANKDLGNFSVDVSFGGNALKSSGRGFNQNVTDFTAPNLYSIENGITKAQNFGIGRSQVNSLYGFAELGYKDFLFLNLAARNDWFSVLNPQNNNYLYPSVSGSLIFSEFLKDVSWLKYGKLRASYADVGSANGIGAFSGLLNYGILQNQFNGQTLGTISNGNSPNPLLTPFSVKEKEVGLEMKLFKNRLTFDVSAYHKITRDQILTVLISNASGYNGTPQNLGSLENKGLEFFIEGVPFQRGNFTWRSSFNTAINNTNVLALAPGTNRLVVTSFGGNEFIGSLVYEVGKPLNQLAGKTYRRNSNGQILLNTNGRLLASEGADVLFGSALPKYTGGWNNTFSYKNLSLLVHIDYKAGGKILSSTALNGLRQGHTKASLVGREGGVIFDGVYASGEKNTKAVDPQTFYTDYRNAQIVDPFLFKSDFVKLRNITLTYNFSNIMKNAKFIKGMTLSASCRNVAILKKYLPDLDPESFASSGDNRVGYEQTTLPTTRNYGVNLNVKF